MKNFFTVGMCVLTLSGLGGALHVSAAEQISQNAFISPVSMETNLIQNGDFTQNFDFWNLLNSGTGTGVIKEEDNIKYAEIANGNIEDNSLNIVALTQKLNSLKDGQKYKISFDYRGESVFRVFFQNGLSFKEVVTDPISNPTNNWTTYSSTFTMDGNYPLCVIDYTNAQDGKSYQTLDVSNVVLTPVN